MQRIQSFTKEAKEEIVKRSLLKMPIIELETREDIVAAVKTLPGAEFIHILAGVALARMFSMRVEDLKAVDSANSLVEVLFSLLKRTGFVDECLRTAEVLHIHDVSRQVH